MSKIPPWKQNSRKTDYLKLITEHFPQLVYQQSKILRHGYDHDVVILDERLVFRFPREAYLKRFQSEVVLLNSISDLITLKTPYYKYRPPDRTFGGYEKINGSPLSVSAFKRLSLSDQTVIAQQVGKFITELDSTPKSVVKKAQLNIDSS